MAEKNEEAERLIQHMLDNARELAPIAVPSKIGTATMALLRRDGAVTLDALEEYFRAELASPENPLEAIRVESVIEYLEDFKGGGASDPQAWQPARKPKPSRRCRQPPPEPMS